MTEGSYIAPPDLDSGEQMKALVQPFCSSALCLFPGARPSSEEYRKAVLILTDNGPDQLPALLENPVLPKSTPILQLLTDESKAFAAPHHGANRLIDCLVVPVSREIFRQRVLFLCKVQKISAEHHASFATLDKQLNALSTRDPLTGLFNRRHLTTRLAELIADG